MEYNVQTFLTEQTRPFYERVINIVKDLEEITHTKVVIFGGFIRNIIECYFNPSIVFKINDVDIWFLNGHSLTTWERSVTHIYNQINICHNSSKKDFHHYGISEHRIDYGVIKMTIDDIKFDMCTRINGFTTFDTLTDFVCNNLYIDINGNINIRVKCEYPINDIIEQIKNKKLIAMLDKEFIETECLTYWNPNDKQFYEDKWKYREDKMLSYGYNY